MAPVSSIGHLPACCREPHPYGTPVFAIGKTFHKASGLQGIHKLGNRRWLDPKPSGQVADPQPNLWRLFAFMCKPVDQLELSGAGSVPEAWTPSEGSYCPEGLEQALGQQPGGRLYGPCTIRTISSIRRSQRGRSRSTPGLVVDLVFVLHGSPLLGNLIVSITNYIDADAKGQGRKDSGDGVS